MHAHDEVAVGLNFQTIANVAKGARGPESFAVVVVENQIAVTLHDQSGGALFVGKTLIGQQVVATWERGVAKVCCKSCGELVHAKGASGSAVGVEVGAGARVLRGILAKDFSGFSRGCIRYGHVVAVNISNTKIAQLQKLFSEPHAFRGQLTLERVQLAESAACAGSSVDSAVAAPNICKRKKARCQITDTILQSG